MDILVLVLTFLLLCVFGVALVAKARDFAAFNASLSSFGLPRSTHTFISLSTLGAEGLVLVSLVIAPLQWAGGLSLGLLALFTVVSGGALLRGRSPRCQCFGNLSPGGIGLPTLLRNLALAGCAAYLLTERRSLISVIASMDAQALVVACLAVGIVGLLAVLLDLLRRYGEALHTLDTLGIDDVTRMTELGFQPGERLPALTLSGWDRHPVSLLEEARRPASKALVLLSTACGHCDDVLPTLERVASRGVQGVVVVQGEPGSTSERLRGVRGHGWTVLFTEHADLTTQFRIAGFPALIPLDEQGNVQGGTRLGRQRIEMFLEDEAGAQTVGTESEQDHDRQDRETTRSLEHGARAI